MRAMDIHCHILPGVDDGAGTQKETRDMLAAASRAGLQDIIATPHLKSTREDTDSIRAAWEQVKPLFESVGIALHLGFECNYRLLLDWEAGALRPFCLAETNVVLLEFSSRGLPLHWENSIQEIQRQGMDVIIAHPERYAPVQQDLSIAIRMVQIGCELQISAGSLMGGMFSKERACAMALLREGLAHYLASDAHCAADYKLYEQAKKKHGHLFKTGILLDSVGKEARHGG